MNDLMSEDRIARIRQPVSDSDLNALSRAASYAWELYKDVRAGLRVAWEVTLETQTVEECCTELVKLLRVARAERDRLQTENAGLRARIQILEAPRESRAPETESHLPVFSIHDEFQMLSLATMPSPAPFLERCHAVGTVCDWAECPRGVNGCPFALQGDR